MAKHAASNNHVFKAELIKSDGKRIMRLFDSKESAQDWQRSRETDGQITIKRLKVNY